MAQQDDDDQRALPMSRDEARQCVERVTHHIEKARALLLELYEREGWLTLGYDSRRGTAFDGDGERNDCGWPNHHVRSSDR